MDETKINEVYFLSSRRTTHQPGEKKKKHSKSENKGVYSGNNPYDGIIRQQRCLFFGMLGLCVFLMIKLAGTGK